MLLCNQTRSITSDLNLVKTSSITIYVLFVHHWTRTIYRSNRVFASSTFSFFYNKFFKKKNEIHKFMKFYCIIINKLIFIILRVLKIFVYLKGEKKAERNVSFWCGTDCYRERNLCWLRGKSHKHIRINNNIIGF